MLSVLIPVYNYDVTKLVGDLRRQLLKALVDFEIIVMEDGSALFLEENKTVELLSGCKYIPLQNNIGRSAIRNKLADTAKYGHLLFLDCDAEICSSDYIENYLAFGNEECVVVGGTAYDEKEQNPDYSLRLKYGREREARSAKNRKIQKYKVFTTFNFLISKSIIEQVRFDESIRGYGYEDTVFGHQLTKSGYNVLHIENALVHKGLDKNDVFLTKTEIGLKNLYRLYKRGNYLYLVNESKVLRTFVRIKKLGMNKLFARVFKFLKKPMRANLLSSSPSLRVYDVYKLLFLCHASITNDNLSE